MGHPKLSEENLLNKAFYFTWYKLVEPGRFMKYFIEMSQS